MSYTNFEKAMKLAPQCQYYQIAGTQDSDLLEKVENAYGFKISRQQHEFFEEYGYMSFLGTEIFGIYKDAFEGIYAGNAVIATLQDRIDYSLPEEWIPVYDYDDGYMAYLDYSCLNSENEPRVIMAIYTGNGYEVTEVIAEDLGDFLLELVEQQLIDSLS